MAVLTGDALPGAVAAVVAGVLEEWSLFRVMRVHALRSLQPGQRLSVAVTTTEVVRRYAVPGGEPCLEIHTPWVSGRRVAEVGDPPWP